MTRAILTQPLTPAAFTPYGDVLEVSGPPDRLINGGRAGRWHDRASIDIIDGRAGVSLFNALHVGLPYSFSLVERHPLGSQAFIPMTLDPFLVIVAPGSTEGPGHPAAFLTAPGQGINLHRGTWHGVLTPLHAPGLFAVIDRVGEGPNLQEHTYPAPWLVTAHAG